MESFFYPKSICIVGASSKEKSIGYEILRSIKEYNFRGKLFPVNPKSKEILGFKCISSIDEIHEEIELGIIVVPKKFVRDSIDQLSAKEVKSIILITAGYRETGEEGKKEEEDILERLKNYKMRMIGPNCMGVINTLDGIKLNATFVAEKPESGGTGFLSQSGALGAAVLNSLRETDIRLAHFISIGNKADISEIDVLDYWLSDDNIKTMAFYLESIDRGLDLIKLYKNKKSNKPLIILKAGKTKAGMKAASSHTGALSSNERIIDSLFKQFGIIRVNTINEMFNTAKGFEHFTIPSGNRIAVVTNAGGPAILAVDKLEERNLVLSEISEFTKSKLREIVHPEGSLNNPVDLLPGGTPEIYKSVNELLLDDNNVDAVVSIFVEPVMVNAFDVIEAVNSIQSEKPIYQVCLPLPEFWNEYKSRSDYNKPIFKNPEDPAELISNILHYENHKGKGYQFDASEQTNLHLSERAVFIDQNEIYSLCERYNIPVVRQKLVFPEELNENEIFDYPLVIKGISKQAVHKTEFNAVKLNLKNYSELKSAAEDIKRSFYGNNLELEMFLLQPFIKVKHELLLGAVRDNSFGPVVMFGSGGKYVEHLEDTGIRSAYLDEVDIENLIENTKIGKIIGGVRGEKGIDMSKLKNIIKSISNLILIEKEITEVDLNPLIVDENFNIHAVDIRIKKRLNEFS